jgi:hypothetical protein
MIWLVVLRPPPLKNDGLRQLITLFPTVSGKPFQIPWFQSPPTSKYKDGPLSSTDMNKSH